MSDSECDTSSVSSIEEPRPTTIKITKNKKPKINETVAKIIDKEKAKASANVKRIREARKQSSKLQNPIEPPAPTPDPRDAELISLRQSLEELKSKLSAPAPAPAPVPAPAEPKPLKEKKPRAPRALKEKDASAPAPVKTKKNAVSEPPAPRPLTRDEILRSILFN